MGASPTPGDLRSPRRRGAGVTVATAWRVPGMLAATAALALAAGCEPRVHGNGVYHEETRSLDAFAGVRMERGVGAVVTVEPGLGQTVKLIGDENVVPHIRTDVDAEVVGSTTVGVLRVWVDVPHFEATIPPRIVVTRPSLVLARAQDGSGIELKRPGGSTAVGDPLAVVLDGASVLAKEYPTGGADVALAHRSTAALHSDGPVTGSVSGDSRLDNSWGSGACEGVERAPGAELVCP